MSTLSTAEVDEIAARHVAAFSGSLRHRVTGWLLAAGIVAYLAFAWWFFAIGTVFAGGNWDIAGNYLADWVSYEVRPDVAFGDNHLEISYPRFSPLGDDPQPGWVTTESAEVEVTKAGAGGSGGGMQSSSGSFLGTVGGKPAPTGGADAADAPDGPALPELVREEAVVRAMVEIGAATLDIRPGQVVATRGGDELVLDIRRNESVDAAGPLPAWASQRAPGEKVILRFGFAGRAEIEDDEVKIRHRFWGWENFLFDTRSPFWGKPIGEVMTLVAFGERIDPLMSNAALAWNNVVNNAEWQHGDVWLKLLQTIVMAFAGTVLATALAFPLAFAAARNIMPNRIANQLLKRLFDFLRSVDMLIWALFFTRAFGPGPLAGISAIFFTDTGTFGKLYSETLENIDDKQREGVRSVGASPALVQRYGVVPQILPVFLSQSLYFWESNTRSATIIGAVGAGGIGLKLWEAMRTNQDWENVAYMVVLILIVVFVFDGFSSAIRHRLMGGGLQRG
ncbi:phosphonate ABC transporter, permease protein PhnE [Mesorhizobium xinjiangense]|uniref:phosphonate ABC transporter, permease protein PhnE n=1 Tax=Mesorhizobium xinjiangense TaxID=2678685 RepID=UPI0012EE2467|nr:phosphonate ABC transporter, permease protein PhnE [Mesorhizobium xinjiangense]